MGVAKANASNAAQGWRDKAPSVQMGTPQISEETPTMPMHSKGSMEGTCGGASWQKKHKSNSYRGRHDDGSRQQRQSAGGMSSKHSSRHTKGTK